MMKRWVWLKIAGVCLFCSAAGLVDASSLVDLYSPGNLGNGTGDATVQKPLSNAGWFAHHGPMATLNHATQWSGGFVQGHVALLTHAGAANLANPYRRLPVLLWTDQMAERADIQALREIRIVQNNQTEAIRPRLAVRIDGRWFVSRETYEHPGGTVATSVTGFADTVWHPLAFEPGSVLTLDLEKEIPFPELQGQMDGIGLFYEQITERARLREIHVRAIR